MSKQSDISTTPVKEAAVKKQIKKLLDSHNIYYFSPFMAGMGRAGIPDIIACCKGHFIGIEAKAGKNKPTELQLREIDRIRQAGGSAIVVNETNLADLEFLIHHIIGA